MSVELDFVKSYAFNPRGLFIAKPLSDNFVAGLGLQ